MARIAIVAEQANVDGALEASLRKGGHEVGVISSDCALRQLSEWAPDLILYDSAAPFGPHEGVLAQIREATDIPLIVLMDGRTDWGVVRMLRLGADDCLGKPYSMPELAARVEAHLRRYWRWGEALGEGYLDGEDKVNTTIAPEVVQELTPAEHKLLACLLERDGGVVTRDELRRSLWSVGEKQVAESTLSLYIHQLRQKLDDAPDHPWSIKTKWGIGYYLAPKTIAIR